MHTSVARLHDIFMYIDRDTDKDAGAALNTSSRLYYFGYGSLVNRDTRPPEESAVPAYLKGWHRCWEHRVGPVDGRFDSCSLSVTSLSIRDTAETDADESAPAVADGIDGVLVQIALEDLPMLDAREAGYDRVRLNLDAFRFQTADTSRELVEDRAEIIMYRSDAEHRGAPSEAHPVLQSYIDCVMAGYFRIYGEAGLVDFINTTHGWDGPILDDRDAPRYLRAQTIDQAQLSWFDHLRTQHGARP